MFKTLILASAAGVAALAALPASAETLNVQGIVAPYCNVSLSNVSSGTASIAFLNAQQVANLELKCNAGSGTKFIVNPRNGDLYNGTLGRINYAMEVRSPSEAAFAIAEQDTLPGDVEGKGKFTRNRAGYSQAIANGVPVALWMNVNVVGESPELDNSGIPLFPANAAPAGTYAETFDFTLTSI